MLQMAKKGRSGRPRKMDAKRQPDGRVKPEVVGPSKEMLDRRIEVLSAMIAEYPQKFAASMALDADAGWHIGRLYLVGQLSQRQKDAADRFRRVSRAYESVLGGLGAPQQPHALDMNRTAGLSNEDDAAYTKRFKRAKAAYERLQLAVSVHGHDVMRAVAGALRGEVVRLDWLRKGLDSIDEV